MESPRKVGQQHSSHTRSHQHQMPNGTAPARILEYPILAESFEKKEPWYVRAGLGVGAMVIKPESPKGWGWNPAVVTLCLVIVSMGVTAVGALMAGAYYLGQRDNEQRHVLERIEEVQQKADKAADDADKAKQLESYNAGGVDATKGHFKPKEKENKQP